MAALTTDRQTPNRGGSELNLPVAANVRIFAGALVAINATSVAQPGAVSTTIRGVGVAVEEANNLGGAASAISVKVRRGVWRMANSSAGDLIALKDIGANCFIVDDQTVALTNGTNTRSIAGVIRDVDASGVWVEF